MHGLRQNIGPQRTVLHEDRAHGGDADRLFPDRGWWINTLANQDVFVVHYRDLHGFGNVLSGRKPKTPPSLEIALRQGRRVGCPGLRPPRERIYDGGIYSVGKLEPFFVFSTSSVVGASVDVDKSPPIDSPVGDHGPKASEIIVEPLGLSLGSHENGEQGGVFIIEPVPGPDHGVSQPIRGYRELHRHEGPIFPVEEFQLFYIVLSVGL